jgi:hypothetical protein
VLRAVGLSASQKNLLQDVDMLQEIKRSLLSTAYIMANLGILAAGDPEFALIKTLITGEAKYHPLEADDDWKMGLGALSMDQSAQSILKGVIMAGAADRLKAEREYNAQAAAEETKRKAASGAGPVGGVHAQAAA